MARRKPRDAAAKLKRALADERRRDAKSQADARAEQQAESAAPAHMRHAVLMRDGTELRGALVRIVNGRPCRATGIPDDALARTARNERITPHHLAAARMFQADHSEAGAGITASAVDYAGVGGGSGDGTGRHMGVLVQIAAKARLDGALRAMAALAPIVVRVLIDSVSPTGIAREQMAGGSYDNPVAELERRRNDVLGKLVTGLGRLADHYQPPRESATGGNAQIRTFGPARRAYETAAA